METSGNVQNRKAQAATKENQPKGLCGLQMSSLRGDADGEHITLLPDMELWHLLPLLGVCLVLILPHLVTFLFLPLGMPLYFLSI